MTKKDISLMIAFIMFIVIMLFASSCAILEGPEARETRKANRHLRKANMHIRKAEHHGAIWNSDTLFKKLNFKVPGIKVEFTPKILTSGKPMIFTKDSVITKIVLVPGKDGKDSLVYVTTDCPDQEVTANVPVLIDKTLQAKKNNTGSWIAAVLAFLIIGIVTGYFLRVLSVLFN